MINPEIKYTKFTLPNGLKCVLYRRPEIHSVAIQVNVDTGALDEDASTNGISHMIEHVVYDGTKDMPTYKDVDRYINKIAGNGNAYTSINKTCFYGYFPNQYSDEALYYYSQVVLHPLLKPSFVEKERTIILDEMKRYLDMVDTHVHNNIIENRFATSKSSFSYDVIGTKSNVESFTVKDLQKYYKEYYIPSNMELYIVGNFNPRTIKKSIYKYFYENSGQKRLKKAPEKRYFTNFPKYSAEKFHAKQKLDLDQYYLTVTFPGYEFLQNKQRNRILVNILNDNLASPQYQQSILWNVLREELGLVYGVDAWRYSMTSRAFNCIQTSFNPKHLKTVLQEIYKGIEKFKKGKCSDEIFQVIKKQIIDTQLMELDKPSNVISWIEEQEQELEFHKDFLTPKAYLKLIKSLKYEDIIATANEIFDWEKVNIGIVSAESTSVITNKLQKAWKDVVKGK